MTVFQSKKDFVKTQRGKLSRLFFTLLLLAALPLFIWAVLTQRIELRKKAATSEPTQICWNRVIRSGGRPEWPNSCKGNPRTDLFCTQILVRLTNTEIRRYNTWVRAGSPYIPGCNEPTPTPTCIPRPACLDATPRCLMPENANYCPPPGCYYQQVTCIQAPCNPILVCPTPGQCNDSACANVQSGNLWMITNCSAQGGADQQLCGYAGRVGVCRGTQFCCPTAGAQWTTNMSACGPTPTPTPQIPCIRRQPLVAMNPNSQNGNPGDALTYTATITNADSQECGSTLFALSNQVDTNFSSQLPYTTLPIPAGATAQVNFKVMSPSTNPWAEVRSLPIGFTATNTISNLSATAHAAYALQMNVPQTMNLRVKLAGVTGSAAEGAKVGVKFYKKDGSILQLSEPLTLTHLASGVYETSATITNPFPVGTQFRINIKGEKHIALTFCRQTGQTNRCGDAEYIVSGSNDFDFTGIPLPPGDLSVQDGQTNRADLDKLTPLMSKICTNLTVAEKLTGDVDYNGCVNVRDVFLLLQTLETRFDE